MPWNTGDVKIIPKQAILIFHRLKEDISLPKGQMHLNYFTIYCTWNTRAPVELRALRLFQHLQHLSGTGRAGVSPEPLWFGRCLYLIRIILKRFLVGGNKNCFIFALKMLSECRGFHFDGNPQNKAPVKSSAVRESCPDSQASLDLGKIRI